MTIALDFPRPGNDDADYTDCCSFSILSRFLDGIERAGKPDGFDLHGVYEIELAWEFLPMDAPAHGATWLTGSGSF
jgi:hypothetical protein